MRLNQRFCSSEDMNISFRKDEIKRTLVKNVSAYLGRPDFGTNTIIIIVRFDYFTI